MKRTVEVSLMGLPFEARISKGGQHILQEAIAVNIDPGPFVQQAFRAAVESHRGNSTPKLGPFGAGEDSFSSLKGSIESRKAELVRNVFRR